MHIGIAFYQATGLTDDSNPRSLASYSEGNLEIEL